MEKEGYLYIITNKYHRVLYVGVTSDLDKRISEHRLRIFGGFSKRYNLNKLVYYQRCGNMIHAIDREKELKGAHRKKKEKLISEMNPHWEDLL